MAFTSASGASAWPSTMLFPPRITLLPAMGTSGTSLLSPGSKRTAVPAGTLSRLPRLAARSNESSPFVSMKWKCDPTWMGLSPVLVTLSKMPGRPLFRVTSPKSSLTTTSPGGPTQSGPVATSFHSSRTMSPRSLTGSSAPASAPSAPSAPAAVLRFLPPFFPPSSPGSGGKASFFGVGRKEPYRASDKSPSSVAIGSCTVTSLVPSTNVPST
mmetsp:Transcript_5724/g.21647  ORF Transcript_5724/g.21647 Transcript_5724/m.21647 type:complete len:213 (+) Transcript_5724:4169-4807(+)